MQLRANARAIFAAVVFAAAFVAHAHAEIRVTDDFGRVVTLHAPAARVISLSPHSTENLFAAGAGAKIVGAIPPLDYPPEAAHIAIVGDHARLNLEAAIALAPELVVAWRTEHNRAGVEKLIQLGIPVFFSKPRDFENIIANIEKFALLTGSRARVSPAKLRAELAEVRARYSRRAMQRVFYQVWSAPLMTLNREDLVSHALAACGAQNIFAHLPVIAPRLSMEAVIAANPDIIIGGRRADLSMWRKWDSVTAVARGNFLAVDSSTMHRPTARMIFGLRELCEQIDAARLARN